MPNLQLLERLRETEVVAICGGMGSGKGYHLGKLSEYHDELGITKPLHRVFPFTTRISRKSELDGEDPYESHPEIRKAPTLQRLRSALRIGELTVRAQIHRSLVRRTYAQAISHLDDIYATRGEAYEPDAVNICEYKASECLRLKRNGTFPKMAAVCLVPCDPDTWYRMLIKREGKIPDDYLKRLREFEESLDVCIEHEAELGVSFVSNDYEEYDELPAYKAIAEVIKGNYKRKYTDLNDRGRTRAIKMREDIRKRIEVEKQKLLVGTRAIQTA